MEISLRSVAKASSHSGREFVPGDRVASFLCRAESGEIERIDLHADEVEGWTTADPLICRWQHTVKDRGDETAEARRSALQSSEELFFALVEAEAEAGAGELAEVRQDRRVLLTLLVLMLERKRILKARDRRSGLYWHPASKREVHVELVDLKPEELLNVREQLGDLV